MGLSFFYEFTAPAEMPASELESFLLEVQQFAKSLSFDPTSVLNVAFNTPERRAVGKKIRRLRAGPFLDSGGPERRLPSEVSLQKERFSKQPLEHLS